MMRLPILVAMFAVGSLALAQPVPEHFARLVQERNGIIPPVPIQDGDQYGGEVNWNLPSNPTPTWLVEALPDALPKKAGVPQSPHRIKVEGGVDGSLAPAKPGQPPVATVAEHWLRLPPQVEAMRPPPAPKHVAPPPPPVRKLGDWPDVPDRLWKKLPNG